MANKEEKVTVKVKKLDPNAIVPEKQTPGSAGFDLYILESANLVPGERKAFPTGIAVEIPEGYEGQIRSRSGRALNEGLIVLNAPGTIDSDYRGEIQVILYNADMADIEIDDLTRVAQLVIQKIPDVEMQVVEEVNNTERGAKGFGSTGVQKEAKSKG